MPVHHPEPALLLDFAAGACPEAVALAVGCHLAACPACHRQAAAFEAAGGALIEALPGVPLADGALEAVLERWDARPVGGVAGPRRRPAAGAGPGDGIPDLLRPYLPAPFPLLAWRRFGAVGSVALAMRSRDHRAILVRVAPGRALPRHTHGGAEYVAVLSGGFRDRGALYDAGDFCVADATVDHAPLAEPDGPCLALVVHDAPLRFTGPFLRLLNPLIG